MLDTHLQQRIFESADLQYTLAESLVRPLSEAAEVLLQGITHGGRVYCCGVGASALHAQYLATRLMHGFERERPPLAVLALAPPEVGTRGGEDPTQAYATPLSVLGQPGDVLIVFSASGRTPAILAAISAAQAQDMAVIAFSGQGGSLSTLLQESDVLLTVPTDRPALIHEMHLLALHGLCDALDHQLLGSPHSD